LDASRHRRGTGLGLSLSLAVAELHNGCIKLSGNEPGLRVAIALPAAQQVLRGEPDVQILKS
jgi:signal transduction histidine kinase